jgi:hypothetical protein
MINSETEDPENKREEISEHREFSMEFHNVIYYSVATGKDDIFRYPGRGKRPSNPWERSQECINTNTRGILRVLSSLGGGQRLTHC